MTNALVTVLFLLMFTIGIALVLNNVQGSVESACDERYNVTSASNFSQAIDKYNTCKSEGWSNWYYIVFLTPMGTVLALGIWNFAKPFG